MDESKIKYWKGRMQDYLHQVDVSLTAKQELIVSAAKTCDLNVADIVVGLSRIRGEMRNLSEIIETCETRTQLLEKAKNESNTTK